MSAGSSILGLLIRLNQSDHKRKVGMVLVSVLGSLTKRTLEGHWLTPWRAVSARSQGAFEVYRCKISVRPPDKDTHKQEGEHEGKPVQKKEKENGYFALFGSHG